MTSTGSWSWTAQGKHPLVKDFFRLGPNLPPAQTFAQWVDAGFRALNRDRQADSPYSWRFWAVSTQRGGLICGILRGSCDGVGRSYPLLLLGAGHLPGWERHWELLPLVLESPWRRLEAMATHKFRDLEQFREELGKIGTLDPSCFGIERPDWMSEASGALSGLTPLEIRQVLTAMAQQGVVSLPLEANTNEEMQKLLWIWLSLIKADNPANPTAVFIGGLPEHTRLQVLRQSLGVEHFARLWTLAPGTVGMS